jgi:hypothetical protein
MISTQPREAERIPLDRVKVLGRLASGAQYAQLPDGREIRVGAELADIELDNPPIPNELHLTSQRVVADHIGRKYRADFSRRGFVVEPGTFERLNATEKARANKTATPRLVDAADLFPVLKKADAQVLPLVDGAMPPEYTVLTKRTTAISSAGRAPIRGIEAIEQFIGRQGISLEAVGTHLLAKGPTVRVADLLRTFEPLLVGRLTGKPAPCALKHREPVPAWTIAIPSLAVCREHLAGPRSDPRVGSQ